MGLEPPHSPGTRTELRSCCCSGFGDASRALLRCAGHSGTLSTVLALFGAQEPCLSPPAAFGTGRAQLKGAGNAALLEPEYPWMSEEGKESGWWCFLVPINLNCLRSDSAALLGGRVRSCLLKSAAFSSQIWIHWFIASNPTRNSEYQLMFVQLYCWSLSLLWPWVNETPLPSCNKKEKCKLRAFQIINPEYNSRHRTHRTRWCSKDKTEHSGARF